MKKCPKCNIIVEEEPGEDPPRFCPNCRAKLVDVAGNDFSAAGAVRNQAGGAQSSIQLQNVEDQELGECKCLKVEFNCNVFAITDYNSMVELRLTRLGDDLKDVEIYWTIGQNDPMKRAQMDVSLKNVKIGCSIPVNLEFQKETAGCYELKIFFYVRTKGGDHRYMFSDKCTIYNGQEKVEPGKFVFHINNSTQHAADIKENVINIADQQKTTNKLIDALREYPQYVSRALYWTNREFEKEVPLATTPPLPQPEPMERVLLRIGSYKLFALGKSSIRLGRVKEGNDLQIRIPGKAENEKPNGFISQYHGILEIVEGTRIRYKDLSTNGTILNHGKRAPRDQFTELPSSGRTLMTFGGNGGIELELAPCFDENHRISSLMLLHQDSRIREGYLMVPCSMRLGDVFNAMDGFVLFFRNGCFLLKTPDGKECTLHMGKDVQYKNIKIGVEESD